MQCFHHPSQQEAAKCTKCGKPICRKCANDYGVAAGEYAGKVLCYDCTAGLVAANVAEIKSIREKTGGIMAILGIFGCFLKEVFLAFKNFFGGSSSLASGNVGGAFRAFYGIFIQLPLSPINAVLRFTRRHQLLKQFDKIIASDSQSLQQMRDYFTYTQTMERNQGIGLAALVAQGSELSDNSYARAVLSNGEQAAWNQLRKSVTKIAENAEVIKSVA